MEFQSKKEKITKINGIMLNTDLELTADNRPVPNFSLFTLAHALQFLHPKLNINVIFQAYTLEQDI